MKEELTIHVTNPETIELIEMDMKKRGVKTYKNWIDKIINLIGAKSKYDHGDVVVDIVTGYTGVVTAFENYYDQMPNRYLVENCIGNGRWICESRLKGEN